MRPIAWILAVLILSGLFASALADPTPRELRIGLEGTGLYVQVVIDPLHDRNGKGRTFDGTAFLLAQDGATTRLVVVERRNPRKLRSVFKLRTERGASPAAAGSIRTSGVPARLIGCRLKIVDKPLGKFRLRGLRHVWIVGDPLEPTLVVESDLERNVAVDHGPLHVAGQVLVPPGATRPAGVDWSVAHAGVSTTGTLLIAPDGSWQGDLPLRAGDNLVRLVLHGRRSAREFAVVLNAGYALAGQLVLAPDVAYVAESRQITATIAIQDAATDPQGVRLVLVDPARGEVDVASMSDDGSLAHGDEIQGDGVYSGILTVNPASGGVLAYRVVVALKTGGVARSETFDVRTTAHVPDSALDAVGALQAQVQAQLESAALAGTLAAAIDQAVADLRASPLVAQVGRSDSGRGIWVVYKAGIAGGVEAPAPGIRGGTAAAPGAPARRPATVRAQGGEPHAGYRHYYVGSRARTNGATKSSAVAPPNVVKSSKAIGIDAQSWDPAWAALGPNEGSLVLPLLADDVYSTTHVLYAGKGLGSVEDFKNFGDYGVIVVSTHGDTFFTGWLGNYWNFKDRGVEIVGSDMAATKSAQRLYEDDLVAGRLVLVGGQFAMTPDFFRHYSGRLPNSLVWMGSCRSAFHGELAAAFIERGAGAYLGFSDYVTVKWCNELSKSLFTKLLAPGALLGDAFVAEQTDPYGTTAKFLKFGPPSLSLHITGVGDAGFESGRISQSWTVSGDARIVSSLGQAAPTEGSAMAIISTGLGFTTDSGAITQTLRLPDDASQVSFDWDFFSEEFMEFVGSIYQDRFRATLTDAADSSVSAVLIDETVDSLASGVVKVSNAFDHGDVYATGWRTKTVGIPAALRGRKAVLRFSVTDVGDSAYDTAVLLDRIEVR